MNDPIHYKVFEPGEAILGIETLTEMLNDWLRENDIMNYRIISIQFSQNAGGWKRLHVWYRQ